MITKWRGEVKLKFSSRKESDNMNDISYNIKGKDSILKGTNMSSREEKKYLLN